MRLPESPPCNFELTSDNEDEAGARVSSVPPPPASGVRAVQHHDLLGVSVVGLKIERVIAEGGIGVVYAARAPDPQTRQGAAPSSADPFGDGARTYAIKVLQQRHVG